MHSAFRRTSMPSFRETRGSPRRRPRLRARPDAAPISTTVTSLPKRRIHLRELEPDIAAAHDQQVPRQEIDLHHRAVGQIGPGRARASVYARPPTLMKMRGREHDITHLRPLAARRNGACPSIDGASCMLSSQRSTPVARSRATISSLRAFTALHVDRDRAADPTTPYSAARRARCAA